MKELKRKENDEDERKGIFKKRIRKKKRIRREMRKRREEKGRKEGRKEGEVKLKNFFGPIFFSNSTN